MSVKKRNKQKTDTYEALRLKGKKMKSKKKKLIPTVGSKVASTEPPPESPKTKPTVKKSRSKALEPSSKEKVRANRFGSVSSDSEPELIASDSWGFTDDISSTQVGFSENTESAHTEQPNFDQGTLSSDLEDSETDEDEDPVDFVSEQFSPDSSDSNDSASIDPSDNGDETSKSSPQPNQSIHTTLDIPTARPSTHCTPSETVPVTGWKAEHDMLKLIETRAVDLSSRSLYVNPVPPNCTLEGLKKLSTTAIAARLACNPHTRLCRRYAFLEYADTQAASVARKAIMGRLFGGQPVNVQTVRPQYTMDMGSNCVDRQQLYITGLHSSVTKTDLSQLFPKANEIDYPHHSSGYPLGYAIVKFVNDDVALEAFHYAHKRVVKGQAIGVNYTISSHGSRLEERTTNPKNRQTASKAKTTVDPSMEAKEQVENPPSVPPVTNTNTSNTKSKVLIQPIIDLDMDAEEPPNQNVIKTNSEPFLKPRDGTNIIAKLLHMRRQTAPVTQMPTDDHDDTVSDDSDADEDEQEEDGESTQESDSEENDDGDKEEAENSENSSSSSEFEFSQPGDPKTPYAENSESSGAEIDQVLANVMRARRGAARALKNPRSAKRKRSVGMSAKAFAHDSKPQKRLKGTFNKLMLSVPSKRERTN